MAKNYDFRKLRVLVVDDSPFMIKVVSNILEALGVGSVYTAHSGREGFDTACRSNPDIVICDWDMDAGEGPELIDLLRNDPKSADPFVNVIMLTGYAELRRVLAARDFGITEFLSKPVSAKALHARLVAMVERPRPYIRVPRDYFGPDRRRVANEGYQGVERREPEDFADIG
jgi:CheY-like chemotaxis protein